MVALYARQSVEKKDSISINDQIARCKQEIEENEEFKIYIDSGYSGKNTERPKFIELMNDLRNSQISKVIVYKIDRISRAIVDFGRIMDEFNKYHVEFVSYSEKFDTSTPIGRAMLNIIMVFAQLERETIQLRVKDNYYSRGKQGFYLGGRAPFGFNKIETRIQDKKSYMFEEDKITSNIIKNIFEQYSCSNISLGKLAKQLTEDNILTNSNHVWSGVSLGRTLRNPVYVKSNVDVYIYLKNKGAIINNDVSDFINDNGCYVYAERSSITTSKFTDLTNSYVTLAPHKGIIDANVWLKSQYKLDDNKQIKNNGKGTHSWLSGLMKCGYCNMAINVVNNNRGNAYINCGGRKLKFCYGRKKTIKLYEIEEEVKTQLFSEISNLNINYNNFDIINNKSNIEINKHKIELVQIDEKIKSYLSKIEMANEIVMNYINDEITRLEKQKNEILGKINKLEKDNKVIINDTDIINSIKIWDTLNIDEKKEIANCFIKRVIITDENIKVIFK